MSFPKLSNILNMILLETQQIVCRYLILLFMLKKKKKKKKTGFVGSVIYIKL